MKEERWRAALHAVRPKLLLSQQVHSVSLSFALTPLVVILSASGLFHGAQQYVCVIQTGTHTAGHCTLRFTVLHVYDLSS